MADRITVVISQSAHGDSRLRSFEDKLLSELLFQQGIDLTVVPDLTQLADDSTGLLCLEGIRGAMVIISDASAELTHSRLAELSIVGKLGHFQGQSIEVMSGTTTTETLAPGIYDAMQRTIYCLDMTAYTATEDVATAITLVQQHLADSRIRGRSDFPLRADGPDAESSTSAQVDPDEVVPVVRPVPRRSELQLEEDPAIDSMLDELDEMDL